MIFNNVLFLRRGDAKHSAIANKYWFRWVIRVAIYPQPTEEQYGACMLTKEELEAL